MAKFQFGDANPGVVHDMEALDLGVLATAPVLGHTAGQYAVEPAPGDDIGFIGSGFTYDAAFRFTGGVVSMFGENNNGALIYQVSDISTAATDLLQWGAANNELVALQTMFSGADSITGSPYSDRLRGFDGNDTIDGKAGEGYLRGDAGDDSITGGSGFDDINGNMGADTVHGGLGDDWSVGGKDGDLLYGDEGADIVYGNLGNDWCDGGPGADLIRGGQQDDVLLGQGGDDWLSGDRGNDTLTGGAGADTFHSFADAGVDRVTDFNRAEGDKVQLDAGTAYAVAQAGADTVIDLGGGGQMILVGVSMSSLTGAWISVG